jgi:hypothetical protein
MRLRRLLPPVPTPAPLSGGRCDGGEERGGSGGGRGGPSVAIAVIFSGRAEAAPSLSLSSPQQGRLRTFRRGAPGETLSLDRFAFRGAEGSSLLLADEGASTGRRGATRTRRRRRRRKVERSHHDHDLLLVVLVGRRRRQLPMRG